MTSKISVKKNRCQFVDDDGTPCKKKVMIGMVSCRCEKVFCNLHRLPEAHACRYDFRQNHLSTMDEQIANMKCVGDKVESRA